MIGSTHIEKAQSVLRKTGLPGWLLYSFQGSNPLALEVLGLQDLMLSRRFAYLIPAHGEPVFIVHAIEKSSFPALPGNWVVFSQREAFIEALKTHVAPLGRVAMEYFPGGGIPYLSRIDAGALELVRGMGIEVVSSAEVLLEFQTWNDSALAAHKAAASTIEEALKHAWSYLRSRIDSLSNLPTEQAVQGEICRVFDQAGMVYDHAPMVAFGPNAANPHHTASTAQLERGQAIMIDLWCKQPGGPYADVTWMGAWEASAALKQAWEVVRRARDAAFDYCHNAYATGQIPKGYQLDQAASAVIREAGFAEHILHRTGHHLGFSATHGNGTHLDDLETHDTRPLIAGLAFTIEPGVYPGPFGVRSEINVFLKHDGPQITTGLQQDLVLL
jgi:Xaa-Pro dipeptidase